MMDRSNPYASPMVAGEKVLLQRPQRSVAISIVSAIGGVVYVAFTVLLLLSTQADHQAGMMFCGNVPVIIGIAISALFSARIAGIFSLVATLVQIGITSVMLVMDIGDAEIVLVINLVITVPMIVISVWGWVHSRRYMEVEQQSIDVPS